RACEHRGPKWPVRGLSANQLACALISMMARSTTRSNQRPDTLMQDRICQVDETSCNARPVCLPQIKPEHIGDAVRPRSDGTECALLPRRHVISARPCSTISECACHYSSPYTIAAHGADGVRRTPRYDRGIPCGSSQSTVLRMRFARVSAETSGGLECRSIERGG